MTPATSRHILGFAAVAGLLADWLLRGGEWRTGFALWVLAVLGAFAWLAARPDIAAADPIAARERRWLAVAGAALALLLAWRDAPMLQAVDHLAILVTALLIAWRARGLPLAALEPRDAAIGALAALSAGLNGASALPPLHDGRTPLHAGALRSVRYAGVGTLVAVPVLLIVAMLLASADPLFARGLEQIGLLLDTAVLGHLAVVLAVTWVVAGALRGGLAPVGVGGAPFPPTPTVPFAAVAPLLGGLTVLLGAWVGVQLRELFGGADYLAATAGVTVAQYARRGFFELIVIAGIVLASLLAADELLPRGGTEARTRFQRLGTVLVGLVGAVLTSAVLRMGLYLRYYGLTDDRVLALALLLWVALVVGWFAWTVLRGDRRRFAPGVLVLSAAWIAALHAADPEARVVEANLARAARGLPFDVAYHARLSADAVPALLAGMDQLPPAVQAALRAELARTWPGRRAARSDWRSRTIAFTAAARRVGS